MTTWDLPDRMRLFGVLLDAITAVGVTPPQDIPVSPPFFENAVDERFCELLTQSGLVDVEITTIAFNHTVSTTDTLWTGLLEGTDEPPRSSWAKPTTPANASAPLSTELPWNTGTATISSFPCPSSLPMVQRALTVSGINRHAIPRSLRPTPRAGRRYYEVLNQAAKPSCWSRGRRVPKKQGDGPPRRNGMPWGGWPDWGKGGCAFWLRCCGSLHSGPPAVIISANQPHTSARNSWPAIVVGLTLLTDRVRIDLEGEPSAVADVTPSAVSERELTCGSTVWLTAKATELEVYGADVPPGTGSLSTRDR